MVDISIVNKTSPEANWNRWTEDEQDHVLSKSDALNENYNTVVVVEHPNLTQCPVPD